MSRIVEAFEAGTYSSPKRDPRLIPEGVPIDVAMSFLRLANNVWRAGLRRTSADFILHGLRWEEQIEKENRDFKLNNNWTSQLARWYQANNPERATLFETRKLREERNAET